MMQIELDTHAARFHAAGREAGTYILDDPFKPYIHPLRTPAGHCLTMAMPMDHRHHKGLMYSLLCADLNFWEERPGSGNCGVQRILRTDVIEGGICQELLWAEEDGSLETYREKRTITVSLRAGGRAFAWSWQSQREALRDHRLVKSEWSSKLPDGRRINYHGLGIRPPWAWAFRMDQFNATAIDGRPLSPEEACGQTGQTFRWWGTIDGFWKAPKAALTIHQEQDFGWFVIRDNFPYLSVGPSVLEEQEIRAGTVFTETYTIIAEDLPD